MIEITGWRDDRSVRYCEFAPWASPLQEPLLADGTPHPQLLAGVQAFVDKCENAGLKLDEGRDMEAHLVVLRQAHGKVGLAIFGWFLMTPKVEAIGQELLDDAEQKARDN